jgi:hypothetical protein
MIWKYLKGDKYWSIVWIFAMAANFSYFVNKKSLFLCCLACYNDYTRSSGLGLLTFNTKWSKDRMRRFLKQSWFNSLVRRIRWRWAILNINCKFECSGWVVKIKIHTRAVGIILFCGKCVLVKLQSSFLS